MMRQGIHVMLASTEVYPVLGLPANGGCALSACGGMTSALLTGNWLPSHGLGPSKKLKKACIVSQPTIRELSEEVAVKQLMGGEAVPGEVAVVGCRRKMYWWCGCHHALRSLFG